MSEMLPAEEADPGADVDAEDAQPQQSLQTPELPSRAMIEEHRIDHWPRARGATSAMKDKDARGVMVRWMSPTE